MRPFCRDSSSDPVVPPYYPEGEQWIGSGDGFYTRDHLGSIREVLVAGSNMLAARYDYDPFGYRTKVEGAYDVDWGFTGHYYHAPSGLHLAPYRAYDSSSGRWISRDPIGERGGLNLYGYVGNNPLRLTDPLGLTPDEEALTNHLNDRTDASGTRNPIGIHDEAIALERQHMPSGHNAHGGRFAHCIANCLLRRRLGDFASRCIREWWDRGEDDPNDVLANLAGANLAGNTGTCVANCLQAYPPR